ncbi:hypothetical protein [Brevibacillus choshinensis]|uniref:hypothetical protein n=2 Tax=Brevibacillus choshinensis TaxID=54911 RepID=UPI002E1BE052|nr:hypothetical protein [Brevibacillus choshinensis]
MILTFLVCSGCSDVPIMTEDQAIQIVKDEYDDPYFPIKIISVKRADGYYEIIWTRDSNCEGGTMKINALTGESEAEHRIC